MTRRRLKRRYKPAFEPVGRVERPPIRRADRYDAQLTVQELGLLKSRLLNGRTMLERIQRTAPKWRHGPNAGKRPAIQTLSNLRQRLRLEQDFEDDQETTEALLTELRKEVPNISQIGRAHV